MKFSEQWLREWVNPAISTEDLVAQVTMAGLEVDGVEAAAGVFSGVVICEILEAEPHPNADKLRVCKVTAGGEQVQVVCGAPNARPGIKVPFAQVGAVLPGDFKIKKAKLRQVESFGMLCSASELGISEENEGIFELAADAPVGQDIREYYGLDDQIIEVDLTPNRGDCLSLSGLAREVGVLNKEPVSSVEIKPIAPQVEDTFAVEIEAGEGCSRYVGRVIKGINPKAKTPLWMLERLRRSGIRGIDPVVDVTNYVMLELGQPMHAFDLAKLKGGIRVRMADAGEKLVLLDGQEVTLNSDTLLISDHQAPLAMAGIMGGEGSGVNAETVDIFLESAYFNPIQIAGRARSYGLHTDSSHRFERGVDYRLQVKAAERATSLLLDIVGGKPGPIIEATDEAFLPKSVSVILRAERIKKLLALDIPANEVEEILTRLGMEVSVAGEGAWSVEVPSYRFDISLEEDLLEELARIYGYNNLPVCSSTATIELKPKTEIKKTLHDLRRVLINRGYQEAITYSFVEPSLQEVFDKKHKAVELANPISADMAVMRTTLWPGLVKALLHNQNRQQDRIRMFETGQRFLPEEGGLIQDRVLAGVVFGSRYPEGWSGKPQPVDFFDVKGDVEQILALGGGLKGYSFEAAEHEVLHPGQSARIMRNGRLAGYLGALHPSICKQLGVSGPVFLFELALAEIEQGVLPEFKELSKFPETRRDLAVLVDESVPVSKLFETAEKEGGEWLKNVTLFDVYQGEGIENGKKSLALGLTWQHPSRTLNDEEVNDVFAAIVSAMQSDFAASLRG
ncbi:phenylalanine--tRNA ligase subunit beta [Motiliproteus sp. MSK22-1]|uniref:phenylalanine--tRNA ligase subunit beta n=1 Tax=Motiliproteus sp. MSK22-1 TaxID=1897630 RepID=UPI000975EA9C|nr:phenylalanine--tRNA ligase subunit beta [Motiliproteus sp. MSK22-1]OMH38161.1 phenylalanine--tRNA ligase subunit beta [Motiliproteus sp. MSK22-1]